MNVSAMPCHDIENMPRAFVKHAWHADSASSFRIKHTLDRNVGSALMECNTYSNTTRLLIQLNLHIFSGC